MDNKDLNIKFLTKALYQKMGFNVHFEIKLRSKSYISTLKVHDISDIDVLGYTFNSDLSLFTIGAECKSGEANALDELYKFLGVSNFYKLDRSYLVKTKIHQNARLIALENNFICLTEAELRKMLLGMNADLDKIIKVENAKYHKLSAYLKRYKSKSEKLIDYIQLDFWNKETWKNIHNLLHIIKQANANPELTFPESIDIVEKYIYYYIAELFTFVLLKNISQAIILNYSDFDNAFTSCLYGGADALNEKRKIQDAVNIATQETWPFEPSWQSSLIEISSRMAQSTAAAALVPNLIQNIVDNHFYEDKLKIDPRFLKNYPDLTRKYTQDIMQFLTIHCNLNPAIYNDFMVL